MASKGYYRVTLEGVDGPLASFTFPEKGGLSAVRNVLSRLETWQVSAIQIRYHQPARDVWAPIV